MTDIFARANRTSLRYDVDVDFKAHHPKTVKFWCQWNCNGRWQVNSVAGVVRFELRDEAIYFRREHP